MLAGRGEPGRQHVEQARERGDLHEHADLDIALDLLASFVHYRVLFGHAPITPAEIECTCEALLRGSATDFDALVERSRRTAGGDAGLCGSATDFDALVERSRRTAGGDAGLHHLHAAPVE